MTTSYPSVSNYLAALDTPRKSLRTLGGRAALVRDERGEALYRVSRSSLRVLCTLDGVPSALRLALRPSDRTPCGRRCEGELLVGGEYFDLWLEEPWAVGPAEPIAEAPRHEYAEGLYAVERNGCWGFADAAGRMVVEAKYDRVEPFCEGRAVVELDTRYGLIDTEGREVVPPTYDELSYDGSHYCYVDKDGYSGAIDRTGRVVVPLEWDWVSEFSNGLLLVERNAQYGYVDTAGRTAIEPIYDDASSFDAHGYASVVKEGLSYSIDKQQNRV